MPYPDGIFTCLVLCAFRVAVSMSLEARRPSHRAPSLATQLTMCVLTLKSSHRPDGKMADALASTLACATANASVNYSWYVPQRPRKLPIARWETADALASSLTCTTVADAPMNYRMYVPQRPRKFPWPRWDFHMFCAYACRASAFSSLVAR